MTTRTPGTPVPGRRNGPRRSPASRDAILAATRSLLTETGYRNLTVDAVADRAGAGKATIYRWWGSKAALVADTLTRNLEQGTPPTGEDPEEDVRAWVTTNVRNHLEGRDEPHIGLFADLFNDPDLRADFSARFLGRRRESGLAALRGAVDAGRLPDDTDLEFLADLCAAFVMYRATARPGGLDAHTIDQLVRLVLDGEPPRRSRTDNPGTETSGGDGGTPAPQDPAAP